MQEKSQKTNKSNQNMKSKINLFFLFFSFSICLLSAAQDVEKNVSITVSGNGKTPDEAKQSALRNAIEQAFGTFVSSKTEILNDDLVKDEITSIASGNIQKFSVISETKVPEGDYVTTLNVTVSITKLSSFVESKGYAVELKGAVFAMNVKQQILNETSELKAINNMVVVLSEIAAKSFDFEINASEPTAVNGSNDLWAIPLTVRVKMNENFSNIPNYFISTMKGISLTEDEVSNYLSLEKVIYPLSVMIFKNGETEPKYHCFYLRKEESLTRIKEWIMSFTLPLSSFSIEDGNSTRGIEDFVKNPKPKEDNFNPAIFLPGGFGGQYHKASSLFESDINYMYLRGYHYKNYGGYFIDEKFPNCKDLRDGVVLQFNRLSNKDEVVLTWVFSDKKTLSELNNLSGYSIHSGKNN
jgi:hypothetical protein